MVNRKRRRRAIGVAILVVWIAVLAWHARREYFRPMAVRLAEASANLVPAASYYSVKLGDATIGPGCNIGAGTITCNYDGQAKYQTVLGRGVFIGSDAQLVAPVRLRDGSYVAAGTTVTQDVPAGALAIGRGRQRNIEGWVARRKQKSHKK